MATQSKHDKAGGGGPGLLTLVLIFAAIAFLIAIVAWPEGGTTPAGDDQAVETAANDTGGQPQADDADDADDNMPPPSVKPDDRPPASDSPDGPTPAGPISPDRMSPDSRSPTAAGSGVGAAGISFDKLEHDFGSMSDTESRQCSFTFTNTGQSLLQITKVTAACACTDTTLDKWNYAPGESGTIKTTFKPTRGGARREVIAVVSNAKPEGLAKLYVTANVTEFLTIEPRTVRFGDVMRHQKHMTRFSVTCRDRNLTIEEVTSNHPHVTAELAETQTGTGRVLVDVTLDADAPWGLIREARLQFTARGELEDGRQVEKQSDVLVLGTVVDQFRASKPTIFPLGPMLPGAEFRKTVTITHMARQPFEMVDVSVADSDLAKMEVEFEHTTSDRSGGYRIVLTGVAGSEDGFIQSVVRFTTRGPGDTPEEVREIAVTGKIDSELNQRETP